MRLVELRRRTASVAAVVTVPAMIAVLALVNDGVPLARVDLNDGGVWVTATSTLKLGRFNAQVEELNAGLVTTGTSFDVLQDAGDVLLLEPTAVSVVDPASVTLQTQVAVPGGTRVAMAAGTVGLVDGAGNVWVRSLAGLASLQVGSDAPDAELGDDARIVATRSGAVLGVAAETGAVTRVTLVDGQARVEEIGTLGPDIEALTAVGEEPVGLSGGTVRTLRGTVDVGGDDLVLQQAGPADESVLVASSRALLEVPLHGGDVREHRSTGTGQAAEPVRVGQCAHAAWAAATGSYLRLCDGDAPEVRDLQGMSSVDRLTFRVNRQVVALNDTVRGRLWLPQQDDELREPNWSDIVPDVELDEQQQDAEGSQTTQDLVAECSEQSAPPAAADDTFGVRPGRTIILPVIDNDSSSQCGILAISEFDPIPPEFGTLEAIYGGRALQLAVSPDATGTVSFVYTITDGRGTSAPSTAQVQLTVRDLGSNQAPLQARTGTLTVEQGSQAQYSALADFTDPDGDDLVLVAASAESGTVRFRQDGTVTYQADGGTLGRTRVHLTVSDGLETVEGELDVDVRAAGSVAPRIDPVHAVTYVDQPVLVQPLAAVRTSTGEAPRLASVTDVAGATVTPNLAEGTFTFTSARPGTYYVSFVVSAAPQQATGLARIDVREHPAQAQPPITVRDRAYLPAGGEVTLDPLANDTDPAGGVLVLQSVEVPADAGVRAAVIGHQLVQISATRTLEVPVTLSYVVSNGAASAVGQIVVHPVPATATAQPPVVANVEVSVRTGGVVTIPVLDHAYDPDGDRLTLSPVLAEPLGEGEGLLFASGDLLRYQAPATPLTARATFSVQDATGNVTAATLTVRVHASDAATKSPPRPRDLTARAFVGDTIRIPVPLVGIDDDGDGITLLGAAAAPTKGRIIEVGADYLEYQALPGETGTDTFTYAVEDWVGLRAVATVRVGISPRPTGASSVTARADDVTVRPGQRVEVRVLANDIDSGGGELTLSETLEMLPGVDAHVDGRRVIVQAPREPGVVQVAYTASNARGGRDTAVLTVTVAAEAVVLPPIAKDVVVPPIDTLGRESVEVDVLAVAQNPSGPLSDLAVSVPASAASTARVSVGGKVVVTLVDRAQTVPYLLTNTSPQAEGISSYAFISVPALGFFPPTNRPKAPELRVASGEQIVIPLDEQVQVAPGRTARIADPLAVTATKSDGSALVRDVATLTFTSAAGYAGPASITVPVTDRTGTDDATGRTSTLTIPITVYAVDDHPPTFDRALIDLAPGETPVTLDLRSLTTGPEGAAVSTELYSYRITSAVPAGFTASLTGTVLTVGAARTTAKGSVASLDLAIGYGRAGSMDAQVDLRAIASTRAKARVVDRVIADGVQGRDSTVDVLAGAFNPFAPDGALTVVGVTVETPGAGVATSTSSTVTVRPDAQFVGQLVTRYRVRDATGDPDREVEGRVTVVVRGKPDTPKAPRIVADGVRDRTVVLAWDPPDNRGEPITGYRVTASSPGGTLVRECASTTCTIDSLTNDTEYTFTVAAKNAVDWSDPSPSSLPARPDAVPDAPAAPTVKFGDRSVDVSWAAPTSPGSQVTRYEVWIERPAGEAGPSTVSTPSLSTTISGLTNGTGYVVRVRAYNRLPTPSGWSPWSAVVVPAKAPEPPTVRAVRAESPVGGQINVSWDPPASNGAAITGYQLTISGGPGSGQRLLSAADTSYAFTGAANGVEYTFDVQATNVAGTGEKGTATNRTYGVPGTVSGVRALASTIDDDAAVGAGRIALTWAKADGNGDEVTGYRVQLNGADADPVGGVAGTARTLEGLTGGQAQTLLVQACNAAGCGAWSAPTTSTPLTLPGEAGQLDYAVTGWGTINRPTQLTATWSAATDGGGTGLAYQVRVRVDGEERVGWRDAGSDTTEAIAIDPSWVKRRGSQVSVDVRTVTSVGTSSAAGTSRVHELAWGSAPGDLGTPTLAVSGQTVTVTWSAPDDGGAPLGDYVLVWELDGDDQPAVTVAAGGPLTATFAVPVGPDDVEVRVTVTASNDLGSSSKRSETVTVRGVVPPPVTVTPPAAP